MRFGTVTCWDPSIATGKIQEDGMSEHNVFTFHDSREFSAGDRVTFDANGEEAINVEFFIIEK